MTEHQESFWDAVARLRQEDPRFRREAYGFLMLALGVAVQALPEERQEDPERRHLTGPELLESMIDLARREFGGMAPMVFREWGVRSSADVGEMVFQLVECGQLGAREEDRREDFHGIDLMRRLAEPVPGVFPTPGPTA